MQICLNNLVFVYLFINLFMFDFITNINKINSQL